MIYCIIGGILGVLGSRIHLYYQEKKMWSEVEKLIKQEFTADDYYYTLKKLQNG